MRFYKCCYFVFCFQDLGMFPCNEIKMVSLISRIIVELTAITNNLILKIIFVFFKSIFIYLKCRAVGKNLFPEYMHRTSMIGSCLQGQVTICKCLNDLAFIYLNGKMY